MRVIFELSGEHPDLPVAEARCVARIITQSIQVAVGEMKDPLTASRLALTHTVLAYLGECQADAASILFLLNDLGIVAHGPFSVRMNRVAGSAMDLPTTEMERLIGSRIRGTISLSAPAVEYRAVISGDRCYLGQLLLRIDRSAYGQRNPGKRPFFHPGVMMPRMARAMVNLTQVRAGEVLYDPFCGTGGILIEAAMVGATTLGSDFEPMMVTGSRKNAPEGGFFLADACYEPVPDRSVDAVVTDLPYGQSVVIRGEGRQQLAAGALKEVIRVLRPGKRAVIVCNQDIRPLAPAQLISVWYCTQRVHRSLTRHIHLFKKSKTPVPLK
ncbi:MAG: methyltransferase domain-containing protein [Methanomicrobiales archaeon]|nr:methyltransferase domain-containing protein [Methanomicrobiales archaeon]